MKITIHRQEAFILNEVAKLDVRDLLDKFPAGEYRITVSNGGRNDVNHAEISTLIKTDK